MELLSLFQNLDMALYALYASLVFFLFIVALSGVLGSFPWKRGIIVVFFLFCLGIGYVSMIELLSRPKPIGLVVWKYLNVESATVLFSQAREGEAIYILMMHEGTEIPRYYRYPWNKEFAESLQRGKKAEEEGEIVGLELKRPFQHSWENRKHPEVNEIPWPKSPDKDVPEEEVYDLNRDELRT